MTYVLVQAAAPTTGPTTWMPEPKRVPVPEPKFPPKRLLVAVDKSPASYSPESTGQAGQDCEDADTGDGDSGGAATAAISANGETCGVQ